MKPIEGNGKIRRTMVGFAAAAGLAAAAAPFVSLHNEDVASAPLQNTDTVVHKSARALDLPQQKPVVPAKAATAKKVVHPTAQEQKALDNLVQKYSQEAGRPVKAMQVNCTFAPNPK